MLLRLLAQQQDARTGSLFVIWYPGKEGRGWLTIIFSFLGSNLCHCIKMWNRGVKAPLLLWFLFLDFSEGIIWSSLLNLDLFVTNFSWNKGCHQPAKAYWDALSSWAYTQRPFHTTWFRKPTYQWLERRRWPKPSQEPDNLEFQQLAPCKPSGLMGQLCGIDRSHKF